MIASGHIESVRVGGATLLRDRVMTGYRKVPADGPVAVGKLGLAGDVQVNKRFHGGPEKAVYGYPVSGYAGWQAEFPALAGQFVPGAMGENLPVLGQDETSLCIGDIIRCGTALLQVAQIREPCSTFGAIHGTTRVVRAMTRSGRCGWYYRVLEPGVIAAGDAHDVVERLNPDWPVARLAVIATGKAGTREALGALSRLNGLTPAWQQRAAEMLARQTER
jgi:MOSC domain-containing protein YiiM